MNHITQGTIIYGLRSDKYPEITTYAIVISARCDIANDKISKLYYLVGVNAKEWFCTKQGFTEAYQQKYDSLKDCFGQQIKKYSLNADLIFELTREQALRIFSSCEKNEGKQKKLIDAYDEILRYVNPDSGLQERKKLVKSVPKPAQDFLKNIMKGSVFHYFFIPEAVYLDNKKMNNGIIVDLQEVCIISLEDAKRIKSPGIDYKILTEDFADEKERLMNMYWLENESDFVEIEGKIRSPWCELLMQRFANDFIRIGVDGPMHSDYESLIATL